MAKVFGWGHNGRQVGGFGIGAFKVEGVTCLGQVEMAKKGCIMG